MKLEYQFDKDKPKVTMELSPESTLTEVVHEFENFLRACGYVFDGRLDIVSETAKCAECLESSVDPVCDKCLGKAYAEEAKEVE